MSKVIKPELQTIKAGSSIKIFNGSVWTNSKPIQNEIKVWWNFSLYGVFKFQYKIKGTVYCCTVDYSDLI